MSDLHVTCSFIEPLTFIDKFYNFKLPLVVPAGTIPQGKSWDDVVSISCVVNALQDNITVCNLIT